MQTLAMATGNYVLPPPHSLEIHDPLAAEKCKRAWANYALAKGLNEKDEAVQVAVQSSAKRPN